MTHPNDLHKLSSHHRDLLRDSYECVCFYCLSRFAYASISKDDWVDDGNTATCPDCVIDAVLPSDFYDPISDDLLKGTSKKPYRAVKSSRRTERRNRSVHGVHEDFEYRPTQKFTRADGFSRFP